MPARTLAVVAVTLCVIVLAACGGGGGPVISKPAPTEPTDPGPSGVTIALPQNHGLSAGEIRVVPGASRELGNVVVSCPAGGAACAVTVAADGTAGYARTGGVPTIAVAHGSWNLPPGHGLSAGEIRVASGASRALGNVVVSCPADGAACVATVAADGTASYVRTGGVPTIMAAYGSWSLPPGHGLAAGEIRVATGASRELGNVVVSCPAGGAVCVATVAADGSASYARTGGVPTVVAAYGSWNLPPGHGLAAGEIRVASGASRELGNVVVSCPAGGAVCVATVAADGSASYARTGGVPVVAAAHGSWDLPPGHGLAAGEIRVAPGASRELGNVVVSCPVDGAACVVTVATDGTASYARIGGVPNVAAAYGSWSLPPGHGLSAGEIRVVPGASRALGNVVVSCPAGSAACVVTIAADGSASYARTGGVPTVAVAHGPWTLPPGHGLAAGEIRVAPGTSRELGNVVVSCPAGSAACVVTIAADGSASYARTGGVPSIAVAYGSWDLPLGHGLAAGEIRVAPGASRELGNVVVSCPAGGAACVATVAAGGTASYARTGGVPTVMAAYGSWTLPPGHGLAAGEIRVAPGASRELGHVVVSCPAGGAACVATVAADGTASYVRTGGTPSVAIWGYAQDNPTAQDLLDHWNDPQTLRSALALSGLSRSDTAERKQDLHALLDVANGDPGNAGVRFRNVRPENMEIIGERDGITYGQWKGGPAGTLDIEFDFRFVHGYDSELMRAGMEREGKLWSWRLKDTFEEHVIKRGSRIHVSHPKYVSLNQDVPVDGLLVFVFEEPSVWAGAPAQPTRPNVNHFQPLWGGVRYPDLGPIVEALGHDPMTRVWAMAHELGHILGVGGWNTLIDAPSGEHLINRENHTFEGPEATRANNGQPVPFQWWFEERKMAVAPGTPGATPDYGHLGVCDSLMSYGATCADGETVPSVPAEIDFAFLADIGYEVLDASTASEPEVYGWGAWGRYSGWGAGVQRTLWLSAEDKFVDRLRAGADAFGIAPGTALADNSALMGAVTWTGSLIGVDLGQDMLPPVLGDAQLRVELSSLRGTARFDDLTVFVENEAAPFRSPSVEHAIEVTGNTFSDADNRISGGFYGGAHEEMAGVLNDRRPDVNLVAGFGGKR